MSAGKHASNAFYAILIGVVAIVYLLVFVFIARNGYGDNIDNYRMLHTWQQMLVNGIYVPSRAQGNLVSEIVLGFLASQFGPLGTNCFGFAMSLLSLALAWILFRKIEANPFRAALALVPIALNPYWENAASTAMDYTHPIPLFLGGILVLLRRRPTLAAILFAIAVGIRISYFPMGLGALAWAWWIERDIAYRRTLVESLCAFVLIAGLIYVPIFISSHLTLAFLTAGVPNWQGYLGLFYRWVYKLLYVYGLLGTAILAAIVWRYSRHVTSADQTPAERFILMGSWAVIAFHLFLFFLVPVRAEYMIPAMFAVSALFLIWKVHPLAILIFSLAEISFWFVSVDLLEIRHVSEEPCTKVVALDATVKPHWVEGVLLSALEGRTQEMACMPRYLLIAPTTMFSPLPPSPFHRAMDLQP